jgi:ubiquinone/menaquinone biosynthesis C-methylase UbiE
MKKKFLPCIFSLFLLAQCVHDTQEWFDQGAVRCNPSKGLHICSQWGYLGEQKFDELVMDGILMLDPPLKDGESIFDLGMGVGAVFQVLQKHYENLKFGGSDLSKPAIDVGKKIFKEHAHRFYDQDMTLKHESVPDNSYDHVVSMGALGMYLTPEDMKTGIKEAVRMTKPGGSLVFTNFIEPTGKNVGSILHKVEKSFWEKELMKPEYQVENLKISTVRHQGDRYQISVRKKSF